MHVWSSVHTEAERPWIRCSRYRDCNLSGRTILSVRKESNGHSRRPQQKGKLEGKDAPWRVLCRGSVPWRAAWGGPRAVFALLPSDVDRVRFRAAYAAWPAAAAWRPRPWLVGSRTDRSGRGGGAVSSFRLSPGAGLLRPFVAAVPAGLEYLSSSRGYLALSDPSISPKAVVLVNPVTGWRVRLPPIGFFRRWLDVTTVVLSADPGAAAEWAAVAVGFPMTSLTYYSSAAGAWAQLDFAAPGYAGVEHYIGRFYVAFGSRICVLEADGDAAAVIPLERVDNGDGADGLDDEPELPGGSGRRILETHLVECDGQLFLVSVHDDDMGGLAVDEGGGKGGGDASAADEGDGPRPERAVALGFVPDAQDGATA
ncbi:uncharacterized protein LOC120667546 [Panicum virgatum]|uniref:KIB1-4 beta-propeller domain-containing protein n=1 Tax=Panicum virgatum TaxID=38727 RepID=A0A8T0U6T7_PANVG|nr:uncharacterized protein LOC120667546 [Panicum virgatum]KAG2616753.1 hypothetical protein PVAP13_3NG176565 [Panicum virgatum]